MSALPQADGDPRPLTKPSDNLRKLRTNLRRELRKRALERVDSFLHETDPDSHMAMCDVLLSHVAVGYEVEVDVVFQVIHPEGPESQPNATDFAGVQ